MVILQVLSLNFDKIVDKNLLTGLNLHIEKVQCDQSVIWSLASELFYLAKQVLIFEGEKKNPEPKHSNSLLTNQRLNLYTPFAVVAFMSLWQTCLGGGKWLDIRKIMIETVKQTKKTTINLKMLLLCMGFSGGSVVKNPPAIQEMWIQSLGQEHPLEKEMFFSNILAWEIPWSGKLMGDSPWSRKRVRHDLGI